MAALTDETHLDDAGALLDEVLTLRAQVVAGAEPWMARLLQGAQAPQPGLVNLAHYLALRRHDLRGLQRKLMWRGISSLGRLESRVLPTLDAVIAALSALTGRSCAITPPMEQDFFGGERRLIEATDTLFGPPPAKRRARIMVTLSSIAAEDPDFVLDLAKHGMDVARINCAHDDQAAWRAMTGHIRKAGERLGRHIPILMDIAGPKIRTEEVLALDNKAKLVSGAVLRLVAGSTPHVSVDVPVSAAVSPPDLLSRLSIKDRFRYDDGKLEGIVESLREAEAVIRITRAKEGGVRLKPEKGINFPDTNLGLSPLSAKDHADLVSVAECADMIGYSFVSQAGDIDLLEDFLSEHCADRHTSRLGLIAKIERPEAVVNLPDLIARAVPRRPFGVMIARGDLAAEIGFERLAEMQEEILWICEAAAVPVIWATQVLEGLVKTGIPSRGEMTDAAMASRAECVMLNKGPAIAGALDVLDSLLARMDAHVFKKTPTLRALQSWT
jgi:pyruvate kinase